MASEPRKSGSNIDSHDFRKSTVMHDVRMRRPLDDAKAL